MLGMEVRDLENLPKLCNGEGGTPQCKHYLHIIHPGGSKFAGRFVVRRFCMLVYEPGDDDGMGPSGNAMPVVCNHYEASERPYNKDLEVLTRDGVQIKAPNQFIPLQSPGSAPEEVRKRIEEALQEDA